MTKRINGLRALFDAIRSNVDDDSVESLRNFTEMAEIVVDEIFWEMEKPTEDYTFGDFNDDYRFITKGKWVIIMDRVLKEKFESCAKD